MYNRYIPTANGSYVRRQMDEPAAPRRAAPAPAPIQSQPTHDAVVAELPPVADCIPEPPRSCETTRPRQNFLQRLLPQNIELGDLLILLILVLLMLDSEEQSDWLTVLLTVAAFLIVQ